MELDYLCCPIDKTTLTLQGQAVLCKYKHEFPIIDGIPVLLVPGVNPTLHVLQTSLQMAKCNDRGNHDPLFLNTLGISKDERAALAKELRAKRSTVDPVVNYLVAHTNGILYKHLVGRLPSYPIPDITLPVGNGRRLLDIGCSWGRWCVAAARRGYRPTGIDPSLGAVLAARRVADNLGVEADFVVADARYLPFSDHCFETVYSYSVLQHFSDDDASAVFKEIGRVLKKRGCLKIQLANCYGLRSVYHQLRRKFREARGFEVRYRTPSRMQAFFDTREFRVEIQSDCYFGLGVQRSDAIFMSFWKRVVLSVSELLKKLAKHFYPLRLFADSIFVIACRR